MIIGGFIISAYLTGFHDQAGPFFCFLSSLSAGAAPGAHHPGILYLAGIPGSVPVFFTRRSLWVSLHALEDASEGGLESEGMSASIVSGDGFRSVSDAELHEMIEGNGLAPDEESDEDDEE